jgi:hypothetical protein
MKVCLICGGPVRAHNSFICSPACEDRDEEITEATRRVMLSKQINKEHAANDEAKT